MQALRRKFRRNYLLRIAVLTAMSALLNEHRLLILDKCISLVSPNRIVMYYCCRVEDARQQAHKYLSIEIIQVNGNCSGKAIVLMITMSYSRCIEKNNMSCEPSQLSSTLSIHDWLSSLDYASNAAHLKMPSTTVMATA